MTSPNEQALQDRIDRLEEQAAYRSEEIESLSEQVRQQWARIDDLTAAIMRLRDRVSEVEDQGESPHAITKPPHY